MREKNKRGISEVVSTVVLILVVIIGVGIVSYLLFPWFSQLLKPDFSSLGLQIGNEYTFYAPANETLYIQVMRDSNSLSEENLSSIKFYVYWNKELRVGTRESVPDIGGSRVYAFRGLPNKPTSIKIAPVVFVDGKQKLGKIVDELNEIREMNEAFEVPGGELDFGDLDVFPAEPAPLPNGSGV